MSRPIAYDCRYFIGDRPCVWHKREGVLCQCARYEQVKERVLIIKLDAMGDVLRTTTLLPALAEAHPGAALTWITRSESKPLLENNPYLSDVIAYGPDALTCLQAQSFHRVINLDASKVSAAIAVAAHGARKDGFLLHSDGYVVPTNSAALRWLELGVFDDLKKLNTRTYQSIMTDILDLPPIPSRYVLELTDAEQDRARAHLRDLGVSIDQPIIGLNTGAGDRWALKQWRLTGFRELIESLQKELGVQIVLLGGPAERARHNELVNNVPAHVFDTGNDNTVRHFAALVSQCGLVVSGDTLAMHIALATQRRVVVLFGPTSSAEIELYGLGEKILPNMECLACYKLTCDFVPNCMDLITVEMVAEAVKRQLVVVKSGNISTVDAQ